MGDDQWVAVADRWNHNINYDPVIVDALPDRYARVLDVGCGDGVLSRALSKSVGRVVGLDRDAPSIDSARRDAAAGNPAKLVDAGDSLTGQHLRIHVDGGAVSR